MNGERISGKIKAAIFDYDGTIMDSMPMWKNAASKFVREVLHREPAPDLDRWIKAMTLENGARILREKYGATGTDEEIVRALLGTVIDEYRTTLELKPGIVSVLEDLKAHGIRMCVATASAKEMIEAGNARHGISGFFEEIFSCMDVGANKRQPDIYHLAAKTLGAKPEETLVFEDVEHAASTAAAAGYRLVGIFDAASADQWEEIKGKSFLALESFTEWPGIEQLQRRVEQE